MNLRNLKSAFILILALMPVGSLHSADQPDYNPDLLIFAGELRFYVEKAKELSQAPESKAEAREKITQDLQACAGRLGRVYFSESASVIQSELNKNLSMILKENKDLKTYFVFLGNAFSAQAARFLQVYQEKQKKMRTAFTIGGAVIGVAVGGGYLFFRSRAASTLAAGSLGGKDYAIAAGAVLGGTAVGFAAGTIYASKLPMDNSIKNAKDFAAKYPHGEDFVGGLDRSSDLQFLRSELETTR